MIEFSDFIHAFFKVDDKAAKGVIMMGTIHWSKGLEADDVYIVQPDTLPLWPSASRSVTGRSTRSCACSSSPTRGHACAYSCSRTSRTTTARTPLALPLGPAFLPLGAADAGDDGG